MTPEKLVERLKQDIGSILKSVVLYGSAAAGDHMGKRSDYNVMVITERLDMPDLKAMARTAAAWAKDGNPPPLLLTLDRLRQSADVFPIELMDIRACHKILYGDDVFADIAITSANLRLELEHELRGKLIQLRERYLITGGKSKGIAEVMVQSWSTYLVLFRAVLRLFQDDVPLKKMDALEALTQYIVFDGDVFRILQDVKEGTRKIRGADADHLFHRYVQAVEAVVDAVDAYGKKDGNRQRMV